MLALLRSLSMESGALIVALCSAVFAVFFVRIPGTAVRWLLLLVTPFALACALYWSPVWLGAESSEYSAWALALIIPWYVLGAVVSIFVAYVVSRTRRKATSENG